MAAPLLLIAWLAACGSDPVETDVVAYQSAMQPLLVRNQAVAQGFLDVASKVKKGEMDGAQIAQKLSTEVSPAADALRDEAAKIAPATPALADAHAVLVQAWSDRASSYHAMSDAWTAGDLAAFDNGKKKNLQSKLDEERYFQTVNQLLRPYDLLLDQYP